MKMDSPTLSEDLPNPVMHQTSGVEKVRARISALVLPAWALDYINRLVNSVSPFSERLCHGHILTIRYILGNKQTNIHIEFSERLGGGKQELFVGCHYLV